jgi:hypothetical protein
VQTIAIERRPAVAFASKHTAGAPRVFAGIVAAPKRLRCLGAVVAVDFLKAELKYRVLHTDVAAL